MLDINNNMYFVKMFEQKLAKYTGFKYAICVDCCTNAILLSLEVKNKLNEINKKHDIIQLSKYTYMSVPMTLMLHNWKINLINDKWKKFYQVGKNTHVYDSATDFKENMFIDYKYSDSLVCVSFQQKKRLNLGRGGVILFNDKKYYKILNRLHYDGRNFNIPDQIEIQNNPHNIIIGYHCYLEPDKAIKGILALNQVHLLPQYKMTSYIKYSDLTKLKIFINDNYK